MAEGSVGGRGSGVVSCLLAFALVPLISQYHRPASVEEALELLRSPRRVALGGGTALNADREPSDLEAVDLQALGLDEITVAESAGRVRVGATATLDAMRRSELLPDSLRALARAEQPSTLRTLATMGGLVAKGSSESLLLAALLAHDAEVELSAPGPDASSTPDAATADAPDADSASASSLAEVLGSGLPPAPGALITAVSVAAEGRTASAGAGRTPADVPIVAVYGRRSTDGVSMALTGVAERPVLVDAGDPTAGLNPPGDFRGSRDYRLHLAATLAARVNEELS